MSYLFGDSTPSPLEINYIDFLRDSLDFCVQLALSTDALQRQTERGDLLHQAARADIERLETLGSTVTSTVKSFSTGEGDSPLARCALAVIRSTSDLVRNEVQGVNAALEIEEAKVDVARAGEREKCVKALEALLLRHDLPISSASLHLKARANAPYAAEVRTSTPLGLVATIELDVPSSHAFGHVFRVDRILPRLEVQAPDAGGWLHKEGKLRGQRLEKLHIIELEFGAKESSIALRAAADGSGPGFDILTSDESPGVRLKRVAERDVSLDPPFDVGEEDAADLLALLQKLEASARELTAHRKALLAAKLDDRPLRDHNAPTLLLERLVQAMAPVVREIAARSPSATELVLKRLVGGGRREEIFVAKAELREKIERLPMSFRSLFDPLGLAGDRGGPPGASNRPPPLPARSAPPRNSEPVPIGTARRPSGPEPRASEPPRPPSDAPKPDVPDEPIDGFQIISLQGEKPATE
jgi:hypothetical protein